MKQVQANGIRMAVELKGEIGVPLVLLHGFPLDHSMWRHQIDALSDGVRVIAPDLRGFGESELGSEKATMELMADDVCALLDSLGVSEPVVLAGFSMGGYVAFQCLKRHPERVRALILCDTRAVADSPEAAAGRAQTAAKVLELGSSVTAEAMLPKMFGPQTAAANPDVVAQARTMMLACKPAGIAAALHAMAARGDMRSLLPTLGVPCLVIVGEHDPISSAAEMREIADAIPGADFQVVPEAGHLAPLEKPAEVNAAFERFIAGLPVLRRGPDSGHALFHHFRPHPWHGLPAGPQPPERVSAYIEITPFDLVKYEVDKASGYLRVDRPQRTSSQPPSLYGFIPRTYCGTRVHALSEGSERGDGDPLDICVISERPIARAEVLLTVRPIGGLQMIDHGEADDKIVAVLEGDLIWGAVEDVADIPAILLERLQHYFLTYKLIPGQQEAVTIQRVYDRAHAARVILAAQEDYREQFGDETQFSDR